MDFDVRFRSKLPEKRPQRDQDFFTDENNKPNTKKSQGYQVLYKILEELKKHPLIFPFLYPVSAAEVPDYYEKIKETMDLSTVEQKMDRKEYDTSYQFALDVRLI